MKNGTLQGSILNKYGLSLGTIATAIGKSKTHVHGILKGERKDPYARAMIKKLFLEKGMLQKEIDTFPLGRGDNNMLQTLLERDAFKVSINSSKEIFESDSFKIALSIMKEAFELRKFVAIIGETGSGKTSLVRCLEEMTMTDGNKVITKLQNLDFRRVSFRQLYEAIHFDIAAENPAHSTEALIRQVRLKLRSLYKEGKKVVLIVDEAHRIDRRTLFAIKDVWESSIGFAKLIGIILIGQDDLATKLDDNKVREIDTRVDRYTLRSISNKEEAKLYVTRLCNAADISDIGSVIESEDVYAEIASRKSNFIGINLLLKKATELSLKAGVDKLTPTIFKSI